MKDYSNTEKSITEADKILKNTIEQEKITSSEAEFLKENEEYQPVAIGIQRYLKELNNTYKLENAEMSRRMELERAEKFLSGELGIEKGKNQRLLDKLRENKKKIGATIASALALGLVYGAGETKARPASPDDFEEFITENITETKNETETGNITEEIIPDWEKDWNTLEEDYNILEKYGENSTKFLQEVYKVDYPGLEPKAHSNPGRTAFEELEKYEPQYVRKVLNDTRRLLDEFPEMNQTEKLKIVSNEILKSFSPVEAIEVRYLVEKTDPSKITVNGSETNLTMLLADRDWDNDRSSNVNEIVKLGESKMSPWAVEIIKEEGSIDIGEAYNITDLSINLPEELSSEEVSEYNTSKLNENSTSLNIFFVDSTVETAAKASLCEDPWSGAYNDPLTYNERTQTSQNDQPPEDTEEEDDEDEEKGEGGGGRGGGGGVR